jgi:hypothetical protein
MLKRFAGPGILFVIALGFQVSGFENIYLAWSLWGVAIIWGVSAVVTWPRLGLFSNSSNDLEIKITPSKYLDEPTINQKNSENPFYRIQPGHHLTAIFGLSILNHSEVRKTHIAQASIELWKRQLFIRNKTLFSLPLEIQDYPNHRPFKDIEISPQSKTAELYFNFAREIPIIIPFPKRSKLMLILELIGTNRRIEYELYTFKHDPKQVPDYPNEKAFLE